MNSTRPQTVYVVTPQRDAYRPRPTSHYPRLRGTTSTAYYDELLPSEMMQKGRAVQEVYVLDFVLCHAKAHACIVSIARRTET